MRLNSKQQQILNERKPRSPKFFDLVSKVTIDITDIGGGLPHNIEGVALLAPYFPKDCGTKFIHREVAV